MSEDEADKVAREIVDDYFDADEHDDEWLIERIADALRTDEPDIFADALASQIDAIRRAAFDEAIRIVGTFSRDCRRRDVIALLEIARDATPTDGPASAPHYHCLCQWVRRTDGGSMSDQCTNPDDCACPCHTEKPRSDKGKHHHVTGVLQEDVDEAEN